MKRFIQLLAVGAITFSAAAQTPPSFPFTLPWDDSSAAITDMRALNHRPAGKFGFVRAKGEHLATTKGRIRFVGVNICMNACFPPHEDAVKIAGRMAKFGINCVRFHHMDGSPAPGGLLQQDMRTLDPEQLDRLDFFIAQLKSNGIYVDLNLHVSRTYPGMETWPRMPSFFKGVDNFEPHMLALQREYARALLRHVNPYTRTRYADESGVAFIEINNENSLVQEWGQGGLDTMPAAYQKELTRRWNLWLSTRYPSAKALAKAWDTAPSPVGDEMLSASLGSWTMEQHGVAKAVREDGPFGPDGDAAVRICVVQPGEQGWHVQFNRPGLRLVAGKPYTFTFWARAETPATIGVNAMLAHEPWTSLWSDEAEIGEVWKQFTFVFRPSASDANARIGFTEMGRLSGAIEFSRLSLRPGGANTTLKDARPGSVAWFKHAGFGSLPPAARRDWIRFLWGTEAGYWAGMRKFIRNDLKAHALIIGSQVCNSPEPLQAEMDVVDNHSYWKHPSFPGRAWDGEDWTVENVPMAGSADTGTLAALAWRRAAGKPYVVTEYNHPAPNSYRAEALPLVFAYAALQDWDGVFAFDYCSDRTLYSAGRIGGFFSIGNDPVKMATLPAAAALFLRGDVASAKTTLLRPLSVAQSQAAITASGGYNAWGSPAGTDPLDVVRHRCGWTPSPTAYVAAPVVAGAGQVASDTRELSWARATTVDTRRSKAVIGNLSPGTSLHGVMVSGEGSAVVTLTVMSGAGFSGPCDILVCAAADARNTGMRWKDEKRNSVGRNWGTAPTIVDGVNATITLPVGVHGVRAWALDERGARGPGIDVRTENGTAVVALRPEYRTLWYEIEVL